MWKHKTWSYSQTNKNTADAQRTIVGGSKGNSTPSKIFQASVRPRTHNWYNIHVKQWMAFPENIESTEITHVYSIW